MPQTFDCPACSAAISAEAPPGSGVQCPLCRHVATVPAVVLPTGAPDPGCTPAPGQTPVSLSYASRDSARRPGAGAAVGALVCGLISVVTACFPLGIVGIILGIRSINRCKREPRRYRGRGLAIAGIWLGCVSFISLGVAISVLSHLRELSRRTVCGANFRGIGCAMYIYAADDPGFFPVIGPIDGGNTGAMRIFGGASPGQFNPDRVNPPGADGVGSPTVDMWAVIREGNSTPRQFTCPSTTDVPDPAMDPSVYYDFQDATNLSYAYQYQHDPDRPPLGPYYDPSGDLSYPDFSRFPIMADANPYLKGGITGGARNDRLSRGRGNSLNHDRVGQNVLYQDGHAVFETGPDLGLAGPTTVPQVSRGRDNIYTWYAPGAAVDPGAAPTPTVCNLGSRSDACLVP